MTVYIVEGESEAIHQLKAKFKGLRDVEVVRATCVDAPDATT